MIFPAILAIPNQLLIPSGSLHCESPPLPRAHARGTRLPSPARAAFATTRRVWSRFGPPTKPYCGGFVPLCTNYTSPYLLILMSRGHPISPRPWSLVLYPIRSHWYPLIILIVSHSCCYSNSKPSPKIYDKWVVETIKIWFIIAL